MTEETIKAIAIVDGSPFVDLPTDLYIPPDALEVCLATFEGPLDLLLYLIRKQNVDILNIPISHITNQYIDYIKMMEILHLELAAEYLLMAALLAEIKSRLLLPRKAFVDEEEDDPRAFLIQKLLEYEQIKKAAEALDTLPRYERNIFDAIVDVSDKEIVKVYPEIDLNQLLLALQGVLTRSEQLASHQIVKERLSVRQRMMIILERLNQSSRVLFSTLFTLVENKAGVVVTFLAILELSKEGIIEIVQTESFAEIEIMLKKSIE